VTNLAPFYTSLPKSPVTVTFGKPFTYNLPSSVDPESLPYTTSILSGPSYVTQLSSTQLKIKPMNCLTDFGDKIVNLKLEDEEPKSTNYSFLIKVINLPPKF
jgi:hypothetical protein